MKWYSLNKYHPPTGHYLLIRIQKKESEQYLYDRHFIASIEDLSGGVKDTNSWEFTCQILDIDLNRYEVTHFCILEPVEIE